MTGSVTRYSLMRGAVNTLDRMSRAASRCAHSGIDWLERRDEQARTRVTAAAPGDTPVTAVPADEPLNTDEMADEAGGESFPASDPPATY
jgi:hypothetical protein